MSRSISECSGRLWLRDMVVWCAFGLAVGLAAEADAEPIQNEGSGAGAIEVQVAVSAPSLPDPGEVNVRLTFLDLAKLEIDAFGDHEADTTVER